MKKINTTILLVGDDDLKCDKESEKELSLKTLGFILPDLEKFNVIIYQGKHGKKILRLKV